MHCNVNVVILMFNLGSLSCKILQSCKILSRGADKSSDSWTYGCTQTASVQVGDWDWVDWIGWVVNGRSGKLSRNAGAPGEVRSG